MEIPSIKPNEHENLHSQVQVQQHFAPKLVPFVGSTDARKSRARCFGVVGPLWTRCPDRATQVDRTPDRLPKDCRPPKDTSLDTNPGEHPGRVFYRAT